MTQFVELLNGKSFAANAKVTKLLKSGKATDVELAQASKTTKHYKDDASFKAKVDEVIENAGKEAVKAEKPQVQSSRGGERRSY